MTEQRVSGNPEHVLRVVTRVSTVLAPIVIVTAFVAGYPSIGIAAALGLALGAANMVFANRLVASGIPFLVTSGFRMLILTGAALLALIIFKSHVAIAFVVGVSIVQFALSAAAALETARS